MTAIYATPRPSWRAPATERPSVTSAELADRYLAGDTKAFYDLYLRHAHELLAYVASLLGCRTSEAEDIVQDVFLTAATRLDQLASTANVRSWLFGIARNQVKRAWQEQRRVEPSGVALDLAGARVGEPIDEPIDEMVDELTIRDLLNRLPRETPRSRCTAPTGTAPGRSHRPEVNVSVVRAHLADLHTRVRQASDSDVAPSRARPTVVLDGHDVIQSRIQQAIELLPFRRREVITRQVWRGMKPKQIAAELGISANCVRVHLNYAYTDLAYRLSMPRDALMAALTPARLLAPTQPRPHTRPAPRPPPERANRPAGIRTAQDAGLRLPSCS